MQEEERDLDGPEDLDPSAHEPEPQAEEPEGSAESSAAEFDETDTSATEPTEETGTDIDSQMPPEMARSCKRPATSGIGMSSIATPVTRTRCGTTWNSASTRWA